MLQVWVTRGEKYVYDSLTETHSVFLFLSVNSSDYNVRTHVRRVQQLEQLTSSLGKKYPPCTALAPLVSLSH